MGMSLLSKKSIEKILLQSEKKEVGFNQTLTASSLIMIGIGSVIGAGIFVLSGQAAAQYAGPAIILSFLISGIACTFAALCYAEFAAMIPVAGSAYTYAYATLGEIFAWIIGWDIMLEYLFGASTVAVGWSGYFVSCLKDFGIIVPDYLSSPPVNYNAETGWFLTGAIINLPAIFIVSILTWIKAIGIKESTKLNNVIVVVKLIVLFLFIFFGITYIMPQNWTPFIPENTGELGHYGVSGILRGAGVIFFSYIGFDVISTLAQETKNPQKNLPIGIIGSLVVCTIIYVLVAGVLTGIVSYTLLNVPDPIAVAINHTGEELFWLRPFIKIGAIAGLSTTTLGLLMAQPRILYAMSSDQLLPVRFAKLHPKYKTPFLATIISGIICAIISGVVPIHILGELVSIGTLLAFAIVCAGVLILRYTQPNAARVFRVPCVHMVCILGVLASFVQMLFLPAETWWRLIAWLALGLVIYFTYSRKHSKI